MTKKNQHAVETLTEKVQKINDLIEQCKKLSDKEQLSFRLSVKAARYFPKNVQPGDTVTTVFTTTTEKGNGTAIREDTVDNYELACTYDGWTSSSDRC